MFSSYPFIFDQFSVQKNILNPAFANDNKALIQSGYNGFNQLSSKLSSFYLNSQLNLKGDSTYYKHTLGFFISADQEGECLSRQKVHGQYAYTARLSYNTYLSTGVSLGLVHNALKANDVVGSASTTRPDLDVGIRISHRRFSGGLSMNQIPASTVRFFNGTYQLKRYGQLLLCYRFNKNRIEGNVDGYARTGPDLWNKIGIGGSLVYNRLFYLGLYYKLKNGLVPQLGLKNIKTGNSFLGILFSYKYPLGSDLSKMANIEVMAELTFR